MKKIYPSTCVVLLLLLCHSAGAQTVYKTVDENGVVNFSDQPPADPSQTEILTIDTPAPQSPEAYQQNLEDMRKATDRLVADREAREKHRAEMRELSPSQQASQQPAPDYNNYYPQYVQPSGHYRRYPRPPLHPGHRPHPEQPIIYPPLAGPHINPGSNAQLMRPLVSNRR